VISLDPGLLVVSLLVVTAAAAVQGSMGLGFGQIAAAGLVWTLPDMMPAVVILMACVVGAASAFRERHNINLPNLQRSLYGRMAGTALAIPLIVVAAQYPQGFPLLFGALLLVAVVISLTPFRPRMSGTALITAGTASGLMGTITAVGAPPMGLVFQDQDVKMARPTLNAFFAIGGIVSLMALWYSGRFSLQHVVMLLYLSPALVAGLFISGKIRKYSGNQFRYFVLAFSTISALMLIAKTIQ
jgi:hypothetical protein